MRKKLAAIKNDKFLRNNAVLFCGSLVVAVLNYLYHPILARMMSIEEFGEVQTLLSLFAQLAITIGIFKVIAVNIVSNQKTKEDSREIILMLYKLAFYTTIIISGLVVISSFFLKSFFHFNSFYPFISLAIILFFGFSISFREAILQGKHRFKALSTNQIILSSGKLIFAAILVYLGWSSFGAISGIIIAQSIAFFYVLSKAKPLFDFSGWNIKIDWRKMKKELKFSALILTVSLCVTFLYTADIMIVKHYFSDEIAGLYSGIAIIARVIFFVTASIAGVLLPSVKMKNDNGNNSKILKKSLFLIFGLGGTTLFVFSLFPEFITNAMIGDRYLVYAHLLPRLSLLLFLTSVINLLFFYLMALRNYNIMFASVSGILIIAISSFLRHDTLTHIIDNFLFGAIVIMGMLGMLFVKRMGYGVRKIHKVKRQVPPL